MTFDLVPRSVKADQHAKYLGKRSRSSKVTIQTNTHGHTGLTARHGSHVLLMTD